MPKFSLLALPLQSRKLFCTNSYNVRVAPGILRKVGLHNAQGDALASQFADHLRPGCNSLLRALRPKCATPALNEPNGLGYVGGLLVVVVSSERGVGVLALGVLALGVVALLSGLGRHWSERSRLDLEGNAVAAISGSFFSCPDVGPHMGRGT